MTRKEAIEKWKIEVTETIGKNRDIAAIDFFIETGMLKVEEEKSIKQKAEKVLYYYSNFPKSIIDGLNRAGLKIVEK